MTNWQIGESGTTVALDEQRRGMVTFTVTNAGAEQDRAVLTITALDGADKAWFTVEEPQRAVAPGASAVYPVKVEVPPGTAAGSYALQAVAYSADRDPGESSATSKRVSLTVAPAEEPAGFPKWLLAVIALAVVAVLAVVLFLLFRKSPPENTEPPVITGTARAVEVLTADPGQWSGAEEFGFQWQRCNEEGDGCQPIDGAALPSYQAGNDDIAARLRVVVTGVNGDGSTTATSAPTDVVQPAPPTPIPVPDVVGLPRSQATAVLSENFQVVSLTSGTAESCDPTVESQSPGPGDELPAGEQVSISSLPSLPPFQCLSGGGGQVTITILDPRVLECFARGKCQDPFLGEEEFRFPADRFGEGGRVTP